jgi:formylglycine-generating enzyme required for sulfatase activity
MPARQGRVAVQPFCHDVHEATADEYAACLMAGKCTRARLDACNGPTIDFEGKGNHPIVCVDFAQAEAYCRFRDKRIPLDEEWEWAARGGDHGWQFPWGNDPPSHQLCWSGQSTRRQTCAVGSHPSGANPWGIEDLAGNVVEWTTTRNDARIAERSGRGGSWKDAARALVRAARPAWFKSDYRAGFLGIRCATDR